MNPETSDSMKARIIEHHKGDRRLAAVEWVVVTEVADQPGGAMRYADAIAFNIWPSRGLAIHGFEVKVYRSDWIRELRDPAKAEAIQAYCDYWWIVAPEGVVQDGELPDGWGLMVPNKGARLRVVAKAARTEAKPPTRSFMASALRRAFQQSPGKIADEAAISAARLEGRKASERDVERLNLEVAHLTRVIEQINVGARAAGYNRRISPYSGDEELQRLGRNAALAAEPADLEAASHRLVATVLSQAGDLQERAERLRASLGHPPGRTSLAVTGGLDRLPATAAGADGDAPASSITADAGSTAAGTAARSGEDRRFHTPIIHERGF